jgi:glycosyltransferase involved in cell wall biosynthesis
LKVLHAISSLDARAGGPPVALAGLAEAQVAAGARVTVIAPEQPAPQDDPFVTFRQTGGVIVQPPASTGPINRHRTLSSVMRDQVAEADVLHIHGLWEDVQSVAAGAARSAGVPYVFRPCGMLDPWSLKGQGRLKWLKKASYLRLRLRRHLDGARALHYTTRAERDLAAALRLRPVPVVEPNGLRWSEFDAPAEPGRFRRSLGLSQRATVLLFLGRLHPKKRPDLLIEAATDLKGAIPELHVVLIGEGEPEYVGSLRKAAAEGGIGDQVHFAGHVGGPDRIAAYRDADVFVLPSHQENFGNSVVESLAAGVPTIISRGVNLYRELESAGVALACDVNAPSVTAALRRWLVDAPQERSKAAVRAKAVARERFDWDQVARRWLGHYERWAT